MALYINGKPVNPIASLFATVVMGVGMVCVLFFLLPFIGGVLLFVLMAVLALAAYGFYYRWRYGDPLKNLQKRFAQQMGQAQGFGDDPQDIHDRSASGSAARSDQINTGVKRTTTVDDAVVVEEIRRR